MQPNQADCDRRKSWVQCSVMGVHPKDLTCIENTICLLSSSTQQQHGISELINYTLASYALPPKKLFIFRKIGGVMHIEYYIHRILQLILYYRFYIWLDLVQRIKRPWLYSLYHVLRMIEITPALKAFVAVLAGATRKQGGPAPCWEDQDEKFVH